MEAPKIHFDDWQHNDFQARRGYAPDFLAKARAKQALRRDEERRQRPEEGAKALEKPLDKEAAVKAAVTAYNDACFRSAVLAMKRNGMPDWVVQILADIGAKHGISPHHMAVGNREAPVVRARNEAIYRVKAKKPSLSMPQLGKWFGRDHTSIMHSLARHSQETGEPSLTGYNLDLLQKRNADRARRMRLKAASQTTGR